MVNAGSEIAVTIEKPAAGGRMIGRYDGQIVLVSGAIPGETVMVKIDRVEKRVAFGATVEILTASPDRRAAVDPLCGGCVYGHIAYARQLELKASIVTDAFSRLGKIALDVPVTVAASPESAYRMRARLRVTPEAAGFYREGSHQICDPATTGQMSHDALDAATTALAALGDTRRSVVAVEISENIPGDQRALHFDVVPDARSLDGALGEAVEAAALTGCTARGQVGPAIGIADPAVSDPIATLTRDRAETGALRRQPTSFFQANRFLLPDLVVGVLDSVISPGPVLDLYAGVGLFSMALAAAGHARITAIEGDRSSGHDLKENAAAFPDVVHALVGRVEDHIISDREREDTIIVDPPRTGISREAMEAVARRGAGRIVYVSCDPATMARDARRLLDTGYRLDSLRAFDLFPNTPHVETLAVFDR